MEVLSPQLAEEDGELWIEFIKRDIPQWETYDLPTATNKWYEVYCDLREMVQRSVDADAEVLKRTIDGIQSEKAKLTPKIISGQRVPGMRRSRTASRPGLALPGQKKQNIFVPQRRNNLMANPTHSLNSRASQVRQAPLSLVMEHQQPVRQPLPKHNETSRAPLAPGRSRLPASSSSSASPHPGPDAKSPGLAEREARLRVIASGKSTPSQDSGEAGKASTQTKKPILKRPLTSPPPFPSPTSSTYYATQASNVDGPAPPSHSETSSKNTPPRPVVTRKRPAPDPFIRPKQRKRVF